MKNYKDTKCTYGYMTVCDDCRVHAPPHVDIYTEVEGFPIVQCEMCKKPAIRDIIWTQTSFLSDGIYSYREYEDGDSWTKKWLLKGEWTDEQVSDTFGIMEHYGGPGRAFSRRPWLQYNGHSTLVTQMGGRDV